MRKKNWIPPHKEFVKTKFVGRRQTGSHPKRIHLTVHQTAQQLPQFLDLRSMGKKLLAKVIPFLPKKKFCLQRSTTATRIHNFPIFQMQSPLTQLQNIFIKNKVQLKWKKNIYPSYWKWKNMVYECTASFHNLWESFSGKWPFSERNATRRPILQWGTRVKRMRKASTT